MREARRRWRKGSAMRSGKVRPDALRRKGGVAGKEVWERLKGSGPMTAMDLARELGLNWKNTMRRIGWLVKAGLVEEMAEKQLKGRYWSPLWRALPRRVEAERAAAA